MDTMNNVMAMHGSAPWHENAESIPDTKNGIFPNDATVQKPYELRKLCADDLFPLAKILGKIGIDELVKTVADEDITSVMKKLLERKKLLSGLKGEQDAEKEAEKAQDAGAEKKDVSSEEFIAGTVVVTRIANKLLLRLEDCRMDVYILLSGLSGMKTEDIKKLDLDIFLQMIMDVIRNEEFVNFYKAALKFMK